MGKIVQHLISNYYQLRGTPDNLYRQWYHSRRHRAAETFASPRAIQMNKAHSLRRNNRTRFPLELKSFIISLVRRSSRDPQTWKRSPHKPTGCLQSPRASRRNRRESMMKDEADEGQAPDLRCTSKLSSKLYYTLLSRWWHPEYSVFVNFKPPQL